MRGKPARRPGRALLRKTKQVSPGLGGRLQKRLVWLGYELIAIRMKPVGEGFMNYGYAALGDAESDLSLTADEAANHYGSNLYRKVVGEADLAGKDLLEVGSGRGAGAAFVRRTWNPRSVTGVDLAGRAVAHCRKRYPISGLSFKQGDAEHLPFAAGSFDVVFNVESSHGYPNVGRFFSEVARVLRPGGTFLFTDFRPVPELARLREQLENVGLSVVEEESITANVVQSLELDNSRKEQIIATRVPRRLRPGAREFMAVRGSQMFDKFSTGELEYIRLMARKP